MKLTVKEYYLFARKYETVNKELLEFIKKLKKKFKIFILSNNSKPTYDFIIQNKGLAELFDKILFSYQVKMKKPNPKFFQKLLEGTDISKEECILIDDRADLIAAAKNMGMKGIQYETLESLKSNLNKILF